MSRVFLLIVIICLLLLSSHSDASSSSKQAHLNLIFAGNMPDIGIGTYGTYSGLAELLENVRAELPPTAFVFAGGSLGPSPLSSLDRGSHIIDILNTLEPDLMTLTKREFSYFEDELTLRAYEAAFPLVSSNLFDPLSNGNLEGILESFLVHKENAKIGFISILDEEVVEEYLLQRVNVLAPKPIILRLAEDLKAQGADLIVLVYSKEQAYYQHWISQNKIDLALRVLPIVQNETSQPSQGVYSIANKEPVTLLRMTWQKHSQNKQLKIDDVKVDLSHLSVNSVTSRLIDEYDQRLFRLLNQKVVQLSGEMHTSRNLVRTREMPFGNIVADALRNYAKADIGFINGGFIRGDKSYQQGADITRRDIAAELPFRARVYVIRVSGEQIRQALENGVSEVELAKGRFPQVSGLSFTYTTNEKAGNRVQSILINGQSIGKDKTYTLATTDYLAKGGDGYHVFTTAAPLNNQVNRPPLVSDTVIRFIQQKKVLDPAVEFRIRRLD